ISSLNNVLAISSGNGLTVSGSGSLSGAGALNLSAGSGDLNVAQNSLSGAITATGSSISRLQSGSGITLGGLTTTGGAAFVPGLSGNLTVLQSASLSVTEGDLTLQNDDTLAGFIQIQNGATLSASATTANGGRIVVGFGAAQQPPVAGTAASGSNLSTS